MAYWTGVAVDIAVGGVALLEGVHLQGDADGGQVRVGHAHAPTASIDFEARWRCWYRSRRRRIRNELLVLRAWTHLERRRR